MSKPLREGGALLTTIRDVARRSGVSIATVSAVTNGGRGVSPAVRARVLEAVRELGYTPSAVARALHSGRTHTLALLVPSVGNPFFADIVQAVERLALQRGYGVLVATSEGDPERVGSYATRLLTMGVDGVLVTPSWDVLRGGVLEAAARRGIPLVALGGSREPPGRDWFTADEDEAGGLLGRYLAGLGHRRVAFLGPGDSAAAGRRLEGLRRGLATAGAGCPPDLVVELDGHDEAAGYGGVQRLLARGAAFSALVAFNDPTALGALNALEDQGLRVPGRVSVAGFGDTVSAFARPKITTVRYPRAELAAAALERLLERIEGLSAAPCVHRLPVELAVRASTRAPRRAARAGRAAGRSSDHAAPP